MADMPLVGVITLEVSDEEINRIAERLSRAVTTEVQVPAQQGSAVPGGESQPSPSQADRGLLDGIRQALLGKAGDNRTIIDAINAGKARPGRTVPGLPVERATPTIINPSAPTPPVPAGTPRTPPTPGVPPVPPVAPRAASQPSPSQADRGLLDAIRQALIGKARPGRTVPGLPVERATPTIINPPRADGARIARGAGNADDHQPVPPDAPRARRNAPDAPHAAASAITSPLGIAAMAVAVPLITAAVAKAFMGLSNRSLARSVGEGAEFSGELTAVNVIRQRGVIERAQVRGSILGESAIRLQRESDETRMLWTQITAPIRGHLNNIYASLHGTIQPVLKQIADVSAALGPRTSLYQPTPGQNMLAFIQQATQNAASNPTPFPMLPPAPMRP